MIRKKTLKNKLHLIFVFFNKHERKLNREMSTEMGKKRAYKMQFFIK